MALGTHESRAPQMNQVSRGYRKILQMVHSRRADEVENNDWEKGGSGDTACGCELTYEMPITREFAYLLLEISSFFERQKSHSS